MNDISKWPFVIARYTSDIPRFYGIVDFNNKLIYLPETVIPPGGISLISVEQGIATYKKMDDSSIRYWAHINGLRIDKYGDDRILMDASPPLCFTNETVRSALSFVMEDMTFDDFIKSVNQTDARKILMDYCINSSDPNCDIPKLVRDALEYLA